MYVGTHTVGGGNPGGEVDNSESVDFGEITFTAVPGGIRLDWPGHHMNDTDWTNYKVYMNNYHWLRHWVLDNSLILSSSAFDVDETAEFVVVAYDFHGGNRRLGEFRGVFNPDPSYNLSLEVSEVYPTEVALYPNPTTDYININGVANGTKGEIYDLSGKLVLSFNYLWSSCDFSSSSWRFICYVWKESTIRLLK